MIKEYLSLGAFCLGLSLAAVCVQTPEKLGSIYIECDAQGKSKEYIINSLDTICQSFTEDRFAKDNQKGLVDFSQYCEIKEELDLEERTVLIKIKY